VRCIVGKVAAKDMIVRTRGTFCVIRELARQASNIGNALDQVKIAITQPAHARRSSEQAGEAQFF